ncbi:MAG: hypothetical protein H0T53_05760 [Herpetosiphonaceae bacterium]|nr:hypothetical protein [Herpetosiphonaceae bacterium]
MRVRQRVIAAICVALVAAGCSTPTPSQIEQTAVVLGCYPYGFPPPLATATAFINPPTVPGIGMPTATVDVGVTLTPTPAPTWTMCTPGPATPSLTPTVRPTATPWTRPTAQPPITRNTPPINLSNMAGYDVEPAVAIHPTEGWAAVVWANWVWEFPNEATIYVKTQGRQSKAWNPARGVNTGAVEKGGGAPAIAIDRAGRIHVVYLSSEGPRHPAYTFSDDHGVTWSSPTAIPQPGNAAGMYYPQLWLDQSDTLHLVYTATSCFDCFRYIHAERPARGGTWASQDQIVPGEKQLFGDGTSLRLPDGTIRSIVAIGCRIGCPHGVGVAIAYRDGSGDAWINRPIPNQNLRVSPQLVQWVDIIQFVDQGQQYVCTAWGQYAKSATQAACSTDNGATWGSTEIIAHHSRTQPPGDPNAPTPTIDPADDGSGEAGDAAVLIAGGYHPELIYDSANHKLLAVWVFVELDQPGQPSTLVYSYRHLDSATWTPVIDGSDQDPPLRLFPDTRRSAARNPRIAHAGSGLAAVTWIEIERDESIEIYVGAFNPGALAAQEK